MGWLKGIPVAFSTGFQATTTVTGELAKVAKDCKLDFVSTASFFNIESTQGTIPCRAWGNPARAQTALILVHGLNANSGWFEPAARQFQHNDIYVVAYDQIGFGQRKSQAFPTHAGWVQDLETVFQYVQNQVGSLPIFLLGNSMGALVSAEVTPSLKPSGLILTDPAFAGNPNLFTPFFTSKTLFKFLINPRWEICEPYNVEQISRSPQAQEQILKDSGRHFSVPSGVFFQIYLLIKQACRKIAEIDCPLLVLTAEHDFIVDNHATMKVFNKLSNKSKIHKEFAGAYHDLLLDPSLNDVTASIVRWIQEHARTPVPV
jgi:alpha-beta hydrolase superfamily lysophospholipase